MVGSSVNDKLGRVWKKAVITYFKVPSQKLHEETEENYEKHQDSQFLDKTYLNVQSECQKSICIK
jgi:hypothetical protein